MNIYHKHLRRMSLVLIIMTILDVLLTILTTVGVRWAQQVGDLTPDQIDLPPAGIFLRGLLILLLAQMARLFHKREEHRRRILQAGFILMLAIIFIQILSDHWALDSLFDAPLILTMMVVYTMFQFRRGERNWERIAFKKSVTLDLKIPTRSHWFNPLVLAPHMELSQDVASAVDSFLNAARVPTPLEIELHGMGKVSEPMQETIREVYLAHYEDEENRINNYLEGRYYRAVMLVVVSFIAVDLSITFAQYQHSSPTATIIAQFAGFSLWQVGSTFFERSEGYESLLRVSIAKHAKLLFR